MLDAANAIMAAAAQSSPAVLVSYSDGKDSRVVLDLALRTFKTIKAFFMYLVPGLECVEEALAQATARTGVPIVQYPHWILAKVLQNGTYCMNGVATNGLPEWKLRNIYDLALAESGIPVIATGAKKSDSMWRRRNLTSAKRADVITPLVDWTKLDVLSYLKFRGIALPSSSAGNATGIDLSTPSLLWLNDTHPADFKRLCEAFPFAEAVVWRRKFHGIAA